MKDYLGLLIFLSVTIHAQIVTIPDANFKAKLLEADTTNQIASSSSSYFLPMKIDANSNGEIEVNEALLVQMLYVENAAISSLTGIDSFSNLRQLFCKNNSMTSLNVNNLIFLRRLDCSHNLLSNLNCQDIENRMDFLDCSYNNLTSLLLPNFYVFLDMGDQMMYANCSHNQLNTIVLKEDEQLSLLDLSYNNLTSLPFHHLEIYGDLILSHNPLTYVNLDNVYVGSQSPDPPYGYLGCEYTNLTELRIPFNVTYSNITNNPNLIHLDIKNGLNDFEWYYELDQNGEETGNIIYSRANISNNPQLALLCVDGIELGYYASIVPATVQVTQNCTLGIATTENNLFTIYPNPTSDIINIEVFNNEPIIKTTINNVLGQTILTFENTTVLDVSSLAKGAYFITVETEVGNETKRILKQ
ncbi:T9SS type A sorting domain-containing protein [Flavobacterium paronense]|uniref:T9SS type A sorting domain-containing protein n=1 Tax=Flavobacterium paronense TaxID=1392775 RepID=A0ABV5GCL6_9FLAO|nr:T9SS type A sorting domain-containing protein [Flavobacterium paronense]MDN3677613.1 T9SS type A sorting domain-containing protein [Flavobacterium paronense]